MLLRSHFSPSVLTVETHASVWGALCSLSTPMLTVAGSKMATRVALSLLKAAGAEELIAGSLDEYEELAVSLATDPERLFQVR